MSFEPSIRQLRTTNARSSVGGSQASLLDQLNRTLAGPVQANLRGIAGGLRANAERAAEAEAVSLTEEQVEIAAKQMRENPKLLASNPHAARLANNIVAARQGSQLSADLSFRIKSDPELLANPDAVEDAIREQREALTELLPEDARVEGIGAFDAGTNEIVNHSAEAFVARRVQEGEAAVGESSRALFDTAFSQSLGEDEATTSEFFKVAAETMMDQIEAGHFVGVSVPKQVASVVENAVAFVASRPELADNVADALADSGLVTDSKQLSRLAELKAWGDTKVISGRIAEGRLEDQERKERSRAATDTYNTIQVEQDGIATQEQVDFMKANDLTVAAKYKDYWLNREVNQKHIVVSGQLDSQINNMISKTDNIEAAEQFLQSMADNFEIPYTYLSSKLLVLQQRGKGGLISSNSQVTASLKRVAVVAETLGTLEESDAFMAAVTEEIVVGGSQIPGLKDDPEKLLKFLKEVETKATSRVTQKVQQDDADRVAKELLNGQLPLPELREDIRTKSAEWKLNRATLNNPGATLADKHVARQVYHTQLAELRDLVDEGHKRETAENFEKSGRIRLGEDVTEFMFQRPLFWTPPVTSFETLKDSLR